MNLTPGDTHLNPCSGIDLYGICMDACIDSSTCSRFAGVPGTNQ